MKCKRCGEIKLSKEFPPFRLLEECEHPPLHCLRCVTSVWEEAKRCSQYNLPVDESTLNLRKCYQILETLFPQISCDNVNNELDGSESGGNITVTRLNGEAFDTPFKPSMTIAALKERIQQFLNVPPEKQNLLYNHRKLEEYNLTHTSLSTIRDNGIKPGAIIHLMVLLCAVPPNLDKVVFDLCWGYPLAGRDYLDALALTFNGQEWLNWIGYINNKSGAGGAIRHSGDVMDDLHQKGHHTIKVSLRSIPSDVTHIFFTLSTWKTSSISHFRSPSLKFYDESRPDQMLCTDVISKAGHRSAIVMCSLSRSDGKWLVHGNGTSSDGKLCHLEPMLGTIQGLISKTGDYPYVPIRKIHYSGPSYRS